VAQLANSFRRFRAVALGTWLSAVTAFAQVPEKIVYGPSQSAREAHQIFADLLKEHRKFPKQQVLSKTTEADLKIFETHDGQQIKSLSNGVAKARFEKFNRDYVDFAKLVNLKTGQFAKDQERLKAIPLSDYKNRSDKELKLKALQGELAQYQTALLILSIEANSSFRQAMSTVDKTKVATAPLAPPFKMPGIYQGSARDRELAKGADKINLTPVDPEFYESQLGKKLERDLRGRVDFWSYDYDADNLYVVIANERAKVSVFEDQGGVRFIRTRVGPGFDSVQSEDTKIEMSTAEGRFLTGNKSEETLFGRMPDKSVKTAPEPIGPGHTHDDGHNH
jgi:hypothetical protein